MAGNNNIDRDGIEHGDDDKKDIVLITNIDIYLNSVGAMLSAILNTATMLVKINIFIKMTFGSNIWQNF